MIFGPGLVGPGPIGHKLMGPDPISHKLLNWQLVCCSLPIETLVAITLVERANLTLLVPNWQVQLGISRLPYYGYSLQQGLYKYPLIVIPEMRQPLYSGSLNLYFIRCFASWLAEFVS